MAGREERYVGREEGHRGGQGGRRGRGRRGREGGEVRRKGGGAGKEAEQSEDQLRM